MSSSSSINQDHAQAVVTNIAQKRAERDTPNVTSFHEHCVWTGVSDAQRDAWLDKRKELVTASDVAAIMGEDPRRDVFDVYVDKVTERPPTKLGLTDPRFWGKVLELPIAHAVADYYGWDIKDGGYLLRSKAHPVVGCTLDAEIRRNSAEGWIPYEGKTSRITKDWSEEDGDLPTHILIQAQVQLLVTQAPRVLVFGLLQGSRPVEVTVHPHEDYHAIIVEQCEWLLDLVLRGEPPTPTARSADALRRLYPTSDGSTVRLPLEAVEWTREVQEITEQLKTMEARSDELKNMLKAAIGSHSYGELPEPVGGKSAWKWGVTAGGARPLLQVKHTKSAGAGPRKALPAPTSIDALPEVGLIQKYARKRRRSKR